MSDRDAFAASVMAAAGKKLVGVSVRANLQEVRSPEDWPPDLVEVSRPTVTLRFEGGVEVEVVRAVAPEDEDGTDAVLRLGVKAMQGLDERRRADKLEAILRDLLAGLKTVGAR